MGAGDGSVSAPTGCSNTWRGSIWRGRIFRGDAGVYYSAPVTASFLRLDPADTVAIVLADVAMGTRIGGVTARAAIPALHKIALADVPTGAAVTRYGQPIGLATQAIAAGDHVHVHNLAVADLARDYRLNCSATVAHAIAEHFARGALGAFPNVDGVAAFTYSGGCGIAPALDYLP
jgi:altronate hydrolase